MMRSTPYHITPQLSQTTPNVFDESGRGLNLLPCALSSGDGNIMVCLWDYRATHHFNTIAQIMTKAKRDSCIDASLRAACVEMG